MIFNVYVVGFLITVIIVIYENKGRDPVDRLPWWWMLAICVFWPLVWFVNIAHRILRYANSR